MSNLQQPNSQEQNMAQVPQGPTPCIWCGGTTGHYGWCDWEQLKSLHEKIDKLTEEIKTIREVRRILAEIVMNQERSPLPWTDRK